MVVAVALTLHDELVAVPRQELDGMKRFDVFVAGLTIEFSDTFARRGIVRHQSTIVLVAIQFEHVDGLGIGTPGNVGEITSLPRPLQREGSFEIDGFVSFQIIDTYCYLMTGHTSHRVLVRLVSSLTWEDVNLRIVCHHALVHAIECQTLSVRTPECSLLYAKLVAMNTLSIDNFATAVGAQLVLFAFAVNHIQLMAFDVGCSA